jgi:organic radical activating enzyme
MQYLVDADESQIDEAYKRSAQLKFVVQDDKDVQHVDKILRRIHYRLERKRPYAYHPTVVLQPEYGMMRRGATAAAVRYAIEWQDRNFRGWDVRVLPQVHKFLAIP